NVPSWVHSTGIAIPAGGGGDLEVDLAFGGLWYVLVDAKNLGIEVVPQNLPALMAKACELREEVRRLSTKDAPQGRLPYPDSCMIYEADTDSGSYRNVVVLAPNKYDRS